MGKVTKLVPRIESAADAVRLLAMRNPEVVVLKHNPISMQVCVPKTMERHDIEAGAGPSGTESGWVIHDESESVQCATDPNRLHWVLVC